MSLDFNILKKQMIEYETKRFSQYAFLSKNATRQSLEEKELKLPFEIDKTKIINSKSFRRMKHKTQVFLNPKGDHYRTRLTHTLEVSTVARYIARYLSLNEDLVEAISMGHDIGHTCFGHAGETALRSIFNNYSHNKQSLRVADHIEKLNLTNQVRDGILNHTGSITPMTLEGQIVKTADRMAYLQHDIDDAIRGKVISFDCIPLYLREIFSSPSDVSTILSLDMIENSMGKPYIQMSEKIETAMLELRDFMFKTVYERPSVEHEIDKAKHIVHSLVDYYLKHPDELSDNYLNSLSDWPIETVIIDYISGMTDGYAIEKFEEIFIPKKYSI